MDDEQTPPASEPAPPQNPLSQLLIELSRVFAAVPQTSEDERNGYIMALLEMARFVREAARSTQDTGLWEAHLRLSELASSPSINESGSYCQSAKLMTSDPNDRPWRLTDLAFVPAGDGRERAAINGVEVIRENGRYWIITPSGPIWSNIDERGVDPALNYLFGKKRQQQEQSSQ
jgi:hypothetical protein